MRFSGVDIPMPYNGALEQAALPQEADIVRLARVWCAMISEVVMPQMGADMVEGTIVRWRSTRATRWPRRNHRRDRDRQSHVEIEAFEGGTFRATLAAEGDVIPVGGIIAIIAAPEDDIL